MSGHRILEDLQDHGFDNVAYTYYTGMGPPHYRDSTGNVVPFEAVQALQARRALENLPPEVTAEDIEKSDSQSESAMQSEDGDGVERLVVESEKGSTTSKGERDNIQDQGDDQDSDEMDTDDDQTQAPAGQGQTSGNAVPANPTATAAKSPRGKRWSEMKEWKKVVAAANGTGPCPDNVYDLVDACLRYQRQPQLKHQYAKVLAKAVKNGWTAKTSELQQAHEDRLKVERRYNKLEKALDLQKSKVARLESELKKAQQKGGKTTVLAAKKSPSKGKNKETASTNLTFQLPLPAVPEARMTSQAPKSVKQYVQHSETLLDQGATMLRSTGEAGWSERTVSWLAMVETRPELKYK